MLTVNGGIPPNHPVYTDMFQELKNTLVKHQIVYINYPAGFGASTILLHAIGWCFNSQVSVIDPVHNPVSTRVDDYKEFTKYVNNFSDKYDPENVTIVYNTPNVVYNLDRSFKDHVIVLDLNSKITKLFDIITLTCLLKRNKSCKYIIVGKENDEVAFHQIKTIFKNALDIDVYKYTPSWENTRHKTISDRLVLVPVKQQAESEAIKTLARKFITQFKKNDTRNRRSMVFILTPYVKTYVKYLDDNVVPKVNGNLRVIDFKETCVKSTKPLEKIYQEFQSVADTYRDNYVVVLNPDDIQTFRFCLTSLEQDQLLIDGIYLINDYPLKENILRSFLNRLNTNDPKTIETLKLFTFNLPGQQELAISKDQYEIDLFKAVIKSFKNGIVPDIITTALEIPTPNFLTYYNWLEAIGVILDKGSTGNVANVSTSRPELKPITQSIFKRIKEPIYKNLNIVIYLMLLYAHHKKPYTLPSVAILIEGPIVDTSKRSFFNNARDKTDDLILQTTSFVRILEEFNVPEFAGLLNEKKITDALISKKYPTYKDFLKACNEKGLDSERVIKTSLTLKQIMEYERVLEFDYSYIGQSYLEQSYNQDLRMAYVAASYFSNLFRVSNTDTGIVTFEPYHNFDVIKQEHQQYTLKPVYTLSSKSVLSANKDKLSVGDVVAATIEGKFLTNVTLIDSELYSQVNSMFNDILK